MSIETTTADAWEEFKRAHGLDTWATPARFAPGEATLAPLRAAVVAALRGRPPKSKRPVRVSRQAGR